jgi:hypothetical protein
MTNKTPWDKLTREQKLAAVMYPNNAEPEIKQAMDAIAKSEGKRPPQGPSPLGGQAIRRDK